MMDLEIVNSSTEGVDAQRDLGGHPITFQARNIRQSGTGMHAEVIIRYRGRDLSRNTFNVTRVTGRRELINEAWPILQLAGEQVTEAYPKTRLTHDTAQFCGYLSQSWEISITDIAEYNHNGRLPDVSFPLYPYLIERGGTLIFAAPGAGKSFIVQAMAVSIASGLSHLWQTEQRPVLYINLERSGASLERREHQLVSALGLPGGKTNVKYLHMRGSPLPTVLGRAKPLLKANPNTVVILDSVSRAGLGSLVEDQVAMEFIDMMGGLGLTWLAIGHTPRGNQDHIFGSVHYDAGADVAIKLSSDDSKTGHLAVMLEVTKANDIMKPPPAYYGLDFSEVTPERWDLTDIKTAKAEDYPELASNMKLKPTEAIIAYIDANGGSAWQSDIVSDLGLNKGNTSTLLNKSPRFVLMQQTGGLNKWGIKARSDEG